MDHNRLWEILEEMGKLECFTCLLRNLYVGEEATVRTGYGTMDWFQIGKGVCKGCILSPCLFNLYSESVHLVQSLSHVQLFAIPWTAARQTSLFIINSWTHVHWVGDAIQPSPPLSSPFPPIFNPSQHQGLFQWDSSPYQVAKVSEFKLQYQSFQWTFRRDIL